ncbi:uncharacterized protein LOC126679365 [Mercurialis annua]|uniref:uncharacterized protein LOC126679365 n=1 Tax=Mercurialis annua TaxID=3986 RepID=UPI00215DF645|nr:uncharacterized protein LOC126679365 [Mercurialis annua]
MFFFFAGGVEQQVSRVLKSGVGRCINCGSMADLVEYDKVVKLFFVPVYRWPAKEPSMYCNNCNLMFPQSFPPTSPSAAVSESLRCYSCDRLLHPDFKFCPFCGASL